MVLSLKLCFTRLLSVSQHLGRLISGCCALMWCSPSSPRLCVKGKAKNFIGGDCFSLLPELVLASLASVAVSWSPEKWRGEIVEFLQRAEASAADLTWQSYFGTTFFLFAAPWVPSLLSVPLPLLTCRTFALRSETTSVFVAIGAH